jgi:hypothetical protein
MRIPVAVLIALATAGFPAAFAQNLPPLIAPAPPVVVPPPPVAPAPVPSVVTPLRTPDYGVPHGINTATPLGGSPQAVYREPRDAPKRRHHRRRHFHNSSR